MPRLDEITNPDLRRVLRDIEASRRSLLSVVTPLTREDLGYARRGGWAIERVLAHVIESEQTYAKLLAHQCGKTAPDPNGTPPAHGDEAATRLAETPANLLSMPDQIHDDNPYRPLPT